MPGVPTGVPTLVPPLLPFPPAPVPCPAPPVPPFPFLRLAILAARAAAALSFFSLTFSSSAFCARRISRGEGLGERSFPRSLAREYGWTACACTVLEVPKDRLGVGAGEALVLEVVCDRGGTERRDVVRPPCAPEAEVLFSAERPDEPAAPFPDTCPFGGPPTPDAAEADAAGLPFFGVTPAWPPPAPVPDFGLTGVMQRVMILPFNGRR